MADVANFRVAPPLRCSHPFELPAGRWCGSPASHVRFNGSEFPAGYFCLQHARPTDRPIPDSFLFRRVSVQLEVTVAGVSLMPGDAEHEAVELLRRALERAGGLVSLHTVHSAVGRYTPPAAAPRGPRLPKGR